MKCKGCRKREMVGEVWKWYLTSLRLPVNVTERFLMVVSQTSDHCSDDMLWCLQFIFYLFLGECHCLPISDWVLNSFLKLNYGHSEWIWHCYRFEIWKSYCCRDGGEWDSLTPSQRESRERSFQNMMLLARFHNNLGSHTIQILIRLTKEVGCTLFTVLSLAGRM